MSTQEQATSQTANSAEELNPFSDESWSATPTKAADTATTEATSQQATQQAAATTVAEQNDLKTHLGFEKWEDAKAELETLRKLKDAPPTKEEIKFANEQSQKLHQAWVEGKEDEVYEFFSQKRKLNHITSLEVNENTAADIVKAAMRTKYKDLTDDEIDYKFNKTFSVPAKPDKGLFDDTEYEEKLSEWSRKVEEVKKELVIEAKLSKPDLEKLKFELKPPDIAKNEQTAQPTQKELDDAAAAKSSFLQSAADVVKGLEGFNVTYKDEAVEIPVTYAFSQDEKNSIQAQVQAFADNGFDANAVFADRWVNKDGTLNTAQFVKDMARLNTDDRASQKFVNDAVSKKMAHYIQATSNIKVENNGGGSGNVAQTAQAELDKMAEHFFSN